MTSPSTPPRIDVSHYRKAIAAAVGGIAVVATVVAEAVGDGVFDVADGVKVFIAAATVFGVYQTPNA
jgi:hypothetical protein